MSLRSRAATRLLFSVIVVYLVISLTFAVVVLTPDSNLEGMLGMAAWSGASEAELAEMRRTYLAARGRDAPLWERYTGWLVNVTLFRWGVSPTVEEPVTEAVGAAVWRTAAYAVPGTVAAWIAGVAAGLRSARHRGSVSDRVGRAASYLLLGLPGFWLAALAIATLGPESYREGGLLWTVVVPAGIVAVGLFAGQVSLTRSRSVDQYGAEYVRFLRAKGLSEGAVDRRVLRNVLVPVLAMTAAELFAVLVLAAVVVERVLGIRGVGWLTYFAAYENDIPLILGTTTVLAVVGVGASLLSDLGSAWLDPRSRGGE
jgi:peptide/nickel transport system permease protein